MKLIYERLNSGMKIIVMSNCEGIWNRKKYKDLRYNESSKGKAVGTIFLGCGGLKLDPHK
jgi:hypothetical protein